MKLFPRADKWNQIARKQRPRAKFRYPFFSFFSGGENVGRLVGPQRLSLSFPTHKWPSFLRLTLLPRGFSVICRGGGKEEKGREGLSRTREPKFAKLSTVS